MKMVDSRLYDILELDPSASTDQIKRAYRRLARQHHPDKNDDKDDTMFKKINFAYSVLSDPDKKSVYDRYGLQGLRDGLGSGLFDDTATDEEQIHNVDDIIVLLMSEITRGLQLQMNQDGIHDVARGIKRTFEAYQTRDYRGMLMEGFRVSVQIYKAWPSSPRSASGRDL